MSILNFCIIILMFRGKFYLLFKYLIFYKLKCWKKVDSLFEMELMFFIFKSCL